MSSAWKYGISAVAINEDTVCAAEALGHSLYKEVKDGLYCIVIVVPDQYTSKCFEAVLDDKNFRQLLV